MSLPSVPSLQSLSRPYTATVGAPTIRAVDPAIFTRRYFAACMSCGFCRDGCCAHGVDVDGRVMVAILSQASRIEAVVGVPRTEWFAGPTEVDADAPGGSTRRTAVRDGYCVFHDSRGRGCLLHGYALATGQDYHDLKPMVSTLFPVTFGDGALLVSDELEDDTLVCAGSGPTAYDAARPELLFYFGEALVRELDAMASAPPVPNAASRSAVR
jgi:hypothetical protein